MEQDIERLQQNNSTDGEGEYVHPSLSRNEQLVAGGSGALSLFLLVDRLMAMGLVPGTIAAGLGVFVGVSGYPFVKPYVDEVRDAMHKRSEVSRQIQAQRRAAALAQATQGEKTDPQDHQIIGDSFINFLKEAQGQDATPKGARTSSEDETLQEEQSDPVDEHRDLDYQLRTYKHMPRYDLPKTGEQDYEEEETYQDEEEEDETREPEDLTIRTLETFFPDVPTAELVRLAYCVLNGQRFDPSINAFLGYGALFVGTQGAGKSNTVAVLLEHAGGVHEMPVIVFDVKREYHTILEVMPEGLWVGPTKAEGKIPPQYFYAFDFAKDEERLKETAEAFMSMVMDDCKQVIFDIPSYIENGVTWNEIAQIMTALLKALFMIEIKHEPGDRLPIMCVFEEAHTFFPQQIEMREKYDPKIIGQLNIIAYDLVNMGRSYGVTMVFSTQRVANIAKWTIANAQNKIVMRHVLDVDLKRCKEEIGDFATTKEIKSLPNGVGYITGPELTGGEYVKVKFDERLTRHDSHTPQIDRIKRKKQQQKTERAGDVYPVSAPGNTVFADRLQRFPSVSAQPLSGNAVNAPGNALTGGTSTVYKEAFTPPETAPETPETGKKKRVQQSVIDTIIYLKKKGTSDRVIAARVGLGGRNYSLYQEIVRRHCSDIVPVATVKK